MPPDTDSFVILESVDSTNNYAMAQIHSGNAKDGNAWFAIEQTQGKGQRGKIWETENGQNIVLTIVADTRFLLLYQQFRLSVAISLGCYDFFIVYHNIRLKIKWPNDLFWNDRKAGGILIENVVTGNIWQWAVIGIGININQTEFCTEKNDPISLKIITGQTYNVMQSARQVCQCIMGRLKELKESGFEKMLAEYNEVLYKISEKIKLKKQNIVFETTITGVSPAGQLQTIDSIQHAFNFGEIEWML